MGSNILRWLDSTSQPSDYYDLLGCKSLDPDINRIVQEIRSVGRELLTYQNHRDPVIAQRAVKLQYELAKAAEVFNNRKKLRTYQETLLRLWSGEYANTLEWNLAGSPTICCNGVPQAKTFTWIVS